MGQLLHRYRQRDDLSADAVVPDAGARRGCDVSRRHRRHRGSSQQRAQDLVGPAGRQDGCAEAAGDCRIWPVVCHAALHRRGDELDAGARAPVHRPTGQRHPWRPARRDAGGFRNLRESRPRVRLPPRHGPRGRRRWPACGVGLSVLLSGRIPHAIYPDDHPGDHRHAHPVSSARGCAAICGGAQFVGQLGTP